MKETGELKITHRDDLPACARAEDLVGYLYGEADEAAARDFAAHAHHCASCQSELEGFGQVRVAIGEWRQQALGSLASIPSIAHAPARIEPVKIAPARQRSALAALREFFTLSPIWMRAATAALVVIFCALAVVTAINFTEQPKFVAANSAGESWVRMLDEPNRQRDEAVNSRPEDGVSERTITLTSTPKPERRRLSPLRRLQPNGTEQPKLAGRRKPKISSQESLAIARDLRLMASMDEEDDLPRLSDLLGDSN